ncbi:MAG: MFS transporter [Candidatus Kariarchaeaceae archaeon]
MSRIFRKDIMAAFFTQLFALYTLSTFGAYFGVHLNNLAATPLIIGVVFASRNLVQIFLRVPLSELSQMVGRKPLIITGSFCYTASLGILFFANHWTMVLLATLVVGVGMSMHWPAVFSYIGDISKDDYGRINGILFQGQDIGIIIGAFVAKYLLDHDIVDLQGLFGISFIVGLVGTVISIIILPEVLEDKNRKVVKSKFHALHSSFVNTIRSLVTFTKQYPLGMVFLFEVLVTFTEFFVSSFFPLLVVVSLGFGDEVVADIVLKSTLFQILLRPYFGRIFDKWGYRWPVLVSLTVSSSMLYALTQIETYESATILSRFDLTLIFYTIAMSAIFICFIATTGATSNTVDPSQRGLAMGVLGVYIASGRSMSSIVLAPVLEVLETGSRDRAEALYDLFGIAAALIFFITVLIGIFSLVLQKKHGY